MEKGGSREKNGINYGGPDGSRDPRFPGISEEDLDDLSLDSEPEGFDECDCVEVEAQKLDRIPYVAVYDNKEAVKQRGYFVPAFLVSATIVKVERDQSRAVHLINPYIYTIDLEHGPYKWTVLRRYVDFQRLHNNLHVYRAGAKITAFFGGTSRVPLLLGYTDGGDLIEPGKNETLDQAMGRAETLKKRKSNQELVIKGSMAQYQRTSKDENGAAAEEGRANLVHGRGAHEPRGSIVSLTGRRKSVHEIQNLRQARHSKLPSFPLLPDSVIGEGGLEERKAQLQKYLSAVLHIRAYRDHSETAEFLEVSRLSFVKNLGAKHKEGFIKRRPGGVYSRGTVRNFCVTRCLAWRTSWLVLKDNFLTYINPKEQTIGDVVLFDRAFEVKTHEDKSEETEGVRKALHLSNLQRELLFKCYTNEEAVRWKAEIEEVIQGVAKIWMQDHPNKSTFPVRPNSYAHWFVDGRSFMEQAANMMEIAKEEIFISDWWLNPQIYLKRPCKDDRWRLDQILKRKSLEGVRIFLLIYREIPQALALGSLQMESYLKNISPNIKVLRHPDHLRAGVISFAHHEKLIIIDQKIAFVGGIDLCYGRWDDHDHKLTDLAGLERCDLDNEMTDNELKQLKLDYQDEGSPPESPFQPDQADKSATNFAFNPKPETAIPEPKKHVDIFDILKMKHERMAAISGHPMWKAKVKSLRDKLKGENRELWLGKDYGNLFYKDLPEPEKAFDDYIDRTVVPRMPWHDMSSIVYGKAARDVSRHFIQRWNGAKGDLAHDNPEYPYLIPKSYDNVGVLKVFRRMSVPCSAQIVRSVGRWSAGLKDPEASVQAAYLKLIADAKHYIYIENQFFVSYVGGTELRNKIAQALFDRIVRAYRNKETFRVYIIMPLLPGFTKASGSMQMVLYWTCTSISKGPRSLIENLKQTIGDYTPYITFCGLRNYGQLLGKLVTEIVYVHSKIIIVDDRFTLIGSANINDRSQYGDRDSEVALLVEDTQFTPSTMNGQPYRSGTFAGSLRRRLFQEHLGLLHSDEQAEAKIHRREIIDVSDPTSSEFFGLWNVTAKRNTKIYDQIFKCAPSDELTTLDSWAKREAEVTSLASSDKAGSLKLLEGVRGHLVEFPLQFLSKSDLMRDRFVPESLMPAYVFN